MLPSLREEPATLGVRRAAVTLAVGVHQNAGVIS